MGGIESDPGGGENNASQRKIKVKRREKRTDGSQRDLGHTFAYCVLAGKRRSVAVCKALQRLRWSVPRLALETAKCLKEIKTVACNSPLLLG